ncbi:hypothetical protein [Clostridium septicum]|uniref:hypothetical protein n=1 Tax=Clostridium septicum TaxID=1504 RepID=UPI001FAAC9BF|nr:hypothetical protein [Clostridium septicum]
MQIIKDMGLFPVIQLFNYSKIPKISWSKEENQIKSIEELEGNSKMLLDTH